MIETFERPVKVPEARISTCMVCNTSIGEHTKRDLIRCLYESNIRLYDSTLDLRWLVAERRFGKLPKGKPINVEKDKDNNTIYVFEEGVMIKVQPDGEIIDVKR